MQPTASVVTRDFGADDGIRTRDPHLGKAVETVRPVLFGPVSWAFVRTVVRPDPLNPLCSRALYLTFGVDVTFVDRRQQRAEERCWKQR